MFQNSRRHMIKLLNVNPLWDVMCQLYFVFVCGNQFRYEVQKNAFYKVGVCDQLDK